MVACSVLRLHAPLPGEGEVNADGNGATLITVGPPTVAKVYSFGILTALEQVR